ncbi:MAG: histidinol-phosphate transaminase [Candidatus Tectomicrobia bacterium RIFCSPLOWO2_02_FULL_70_19]|nr:MAG: histidinol-phosphate transaminase [Candidatus Tectomicrobia bacterium RIFCSPLOWO2_02_FULL_70_19]
MKFQTARPVAGITVYQPGKPIEEVERELGISGSIKLASNENPLGPSPKALAAVQRALGDLNRYPDGGGYYLKRALAKHHELTPEHFVLGNGTNEVLELLAHAFLDPGDPVVFSEGAFIVYLIVSQLTSCEMRTAPMRDFTHDLEAMAARVDERTKAVFIANPNNPTGTAVGEKALRRLLERVPERTLVVVDEAYCHFAHREDYPDAVRLIPEFPNVVALRTFSKVYGLAGLRVGYGVAHPEVAAAMERVREPFNVNSLALAAAEAALEDREHVEESIRVNDVGREFLVRELAALGLPFVPTQGNFMMVEVGDAKGVYEALLREGVIVRPVAGYGFPRHLRVSIGTPEENRRVVESFANILKK